MKFVYFILPFVFCGSAGAQATGGVASKDSDLLGMFSAPVAGREMQLPLEALRNNPDVKGVYLQRTKEAPSFAVISAVGSDSALVLEENGQRLMTWGELSRVYSGRAFIPSKDVTSLEIDDPIRVVPVRSLGPGAVVETTFRLVNKGTFPLDVSVKSTSCGCTSAKLDKTHIKGGQKAALKVATTADDSRLISVTISVGGKAGTVRQVAVFTKRPSLDFIEPGPISMFGQKGSTFEAQRAFSLPSSWSIRRVVSSHSWLRPEVCPLIEDVNVTGRKPYRLDVKTLPNAPAGQLEGEIRLELAGAPIDKIFVPVSTYVSNDITASTSMLVLNSTPTGINRRIVIVRGPKPFAVSDITSTGLQIKLVGTLGFVAKAHAVELAIAIEGPEGKAFAGRAMLRVSTGRELPIDVVGTIGSGHVSGLAEKLLLEQNAPPIMGRDAENRQFDSHGLLGKRNLILTFFPKCFTGGCSSQLTSLRDAASALAKTGTDIVAVSTDDERDVLGFSKDLRLPFPILVDRNGEISRAFGALQEGEKLPSRLTVFVNKAGVVKYIDRDVDVLRHGMDMLKVAQTFDDSSTLMGP